MVHKHGANGFMVVSCERRQKASNGRGVKGRKQEKKRQVKQDSAILETVYVRKKELL